MDQIQKNFSYLIVIEISTHYADYDKKILYSIYKQVDIKF